MHWQVAKKPDMLDVALLEDDDKPRSTEKKQEGGIWNSITRLLFVVNVYCFRNESNRRSKWLFTFTSSKKTP